MRLFCTFCWLAFFPLMAKAVQPDAVEPKAVHQLTAQLAGDSSQRSAAVQMLIQKGISVVPDVAGLAGSKDPDVSGAANQIIQSLGFDQSIDYCIANLSSPDESTRYRCAVALTILTNHHFGYSTTDDAETRAKIIAKWRTWRSSKRHVPVNANASK